IGIGLTLIALDISAWLERLKSAASSHLSDRPSQYVRWAQQLPLRQSIQGLPSFGIVAVMIYLVLLIPMWVMLAGFNPVSRGLRVSIMKPGATLPKSDEWTDPLIVRIQDDGAGEAPKLLLNSKPVSWVDLDAALKQELGRRRDWVVYVEADDWVP